MKKNIIILFLLIYILSACNKSENEKPLPTILCIDKSGREYKTIRIGEQIWMAENLAYLPQINKGYSTSIFEPKYYVYNYDGINIKEATSTDKYKIYGVLYNKEAAIQSCPAGWHIPTDKEWKILELEIGLPQEQLDETEYRGNESLSINSRSSYLWKSNNGNNSNSLNIFPSGYKDTESFKNLGISSSFWTQSDFNENETWVREFSSIYPGIRRITNLRQNAFSVRCIKD